MDHARWQSGLTLDEFMAGMKTHQAAVRQREADLKAHGEELRALSNPSQTLLATTDAPILDSALRHALSDTSTTADALLLAELDREEISIRSATGLPAESSVSHRPVTFSFDLTRPVCRGYGKAP